MPAALLLFDPTLAGSLDGVDLELLLSDRPISLALATLGTLTLALQALREGRRGASVAFASLFATTLALNAAIEAPLFVAALLFFATIPTVELLSTVGRGVTTLPHRFRPWILIAWSGAIWALLFSLVKVEGLGGHLWP